MNNCWEKLIVILLTLSKWKKLIVILLPLNKWKIVAILHNLSKWKKIDSHSPDIKQIISQKLLSEKLGDLGDAVRRHCLLCFLVSRCYLQDAMPCQWSSNDLPRLLRIWYSVFISQVTFTVHFFLLFSRLP